MGNYLYHRFFSISTNVLMKFLKAMKKIDFAAKTLLNTHFVLEEMTDNFNIQIALSSSNLAQRLIITIRLFTKQFCRFLFFYQKVSQMSFTSNLLTFTDAWGCNLQILGNTVVSFLKQFVGNAWWNGNNFRQDWKRFHQQCRLMIFISNVSWWLAM